LAVITPESSAANPLAKFNVAFTLPNPFWRDVNPVTWASPAGLPVSEILTLQSFIGATAPMEDLQFTVTGKVSQFKLQALENGSPLELDCWVQYNAGVNSAATLTLDSSDWCATSPIRDLTSGCRCRQAGRTLRLRSHGAALIPTPTPSSQSLATGSTW